MNKTISFSAALISLSVTGNLLANDTIEALKDCARTDDQTTRIACYEALGQKVLATDQAKAPVASIETKSASSNAETTVKAEEVTVGLPDSIGGGEFAEAAGIKKESYRGRLKECRKSSDRKWFYIFENGQVWKQVDRRKRRHKNCDVDVVFTEDNFGYVMQMDGEESKIRVDRRR